MKGVRFCPLFRTNATPYSDMLHECIWMMLVYKKSEVGFVARQMCLSKEMHHRQTVRRGDITMESISFIGEDMMGIITTQKENILSLNILTTKLLCRALLFCFSFSYLSVTSCRVCSRSKAFIWNTRRELFQRTKLCDFTQLFFPVTPHEIQTWTFLTPIKL